MKDRHIYIALLVVLFCVCLIICSDDAKGQGGAPSIVKVDTIIDAGVPNDTEGFGLAGGKLLQALKVKNLIEGSNITIAKSGMILQHR